MRLPSPPALGVLFAAWLVCAGSQAADAQATPGTARPDPLDARASVPPVTHDSPLQRYRAHRDVQMAPWKDANDTVTRIGGWRVYAREAAAPEAATPPSPPPQPAGGEQRGQQQRHQHGHQHGHRH